MWIQNFFKSLTSTSTRRHPTHRPASRPCLEALEDRCLFGNSSNSLFTKSRAIGTILNDD